MEDKKTIIGLLSSVVEEYLRMRTDDFKDNIITGLSLGFSRVLAILVITMLLLIVLVVFAFAFIVLLGDAIGDLSMAAFIVGGVFLTGTVILFLLRKRLFHSMFTNLFTELMKTESSADNWKTLLLMIVRNIRSSLDA
ncbi:MAG: phage holin family protein [Bacteroidales bacterium]|nr:phage holin family protein [Bacteroidales bacterium]MBQ6688911.1 phage holin family protein [Bacteroidales bacterium]